MSNIFHSLTGIFFVYTSAGNWGKGTDLVTAQKNAKLKRGEKYNVQIYCVKYDCPDFKAIYDSINSEASFCHNNDEAFIAMVNKYAVGNIVLEGLTK